MCSSATVAVIAEHARSGNDPTRTASSLPRGAAWQGACPQDPSEQIPIPFFPLLAGTCALPIKRANPDGTTSLFAVLELSEASEPAAPATCDAAMAAADVMGGTLPDITSVADVALLRAVVTQAAGEPVWVAPVDPTSALAAALGYASAPAPGEMNALVLVSGNVRLVNVPCSKEGVALMETTVVGSADAPATITCTKQEAVQPEGQACEYTVMGASEPSSASAAQEAAAALGKSLVSFASQAEYDAVRASLAGSNAAALLARGALAGLWVDMAGSVYTPDGYTLPRAGEASLLAGASLTPTNVPTATTVAGALVEKCSEVNDAIGGWGTLHMLVLVAVRA